MTDAGPNWIQREVPNEFDRMCVGFDQGRVVSTLEPMARLTVTAVEVLRVAGVQALHAERQIRLHDPHDQVVMGRHEDERVARPIVSGSDVIEERKKVAPINVVAVDRLASHTATRHVIHATRKLKARGTSHATTLGVAARPSPPHACLGPDLSRFCGGV